MKDILPDIARLLNSLAEIELAFPERNETLPLITLTETGNSASVILSGKDRYSIITVQADVYAADPQTAREIAVSASGILAEKGIKRTFSQLITDEKYPRVCMRFRLGIDEETGRTVSL